MARTVALPLAELCGRAEGAEGALRREGLDGAPRKIWEIAA